MKNKKAERVETMKKPTKKEVEEQQKKREAENKARWQKGIQGLVEAELQVAATRAQLTFPTLDAEQFLQSARIAWHRAKVVSGQ